MGKSLAIALCRVSSAEQLKNGSLSRQHESVLNTANELGVDIIRYWSGAVSTLRGKNIKRRDLKEMLAECKRNKNIKYLIINEPDRFMRSVDEAFYFEVCFKQIGVKVWYADNELNADDSKARMFKFMEYFRGETSNAERVYKSVAGHEKALRDGRFTFPCRFSYVKTLLPGIHEPHPIIAPILTDIMERIATRLISPPQALKELNTSDAMTGRSPLKMDKFRRILLDPYYSGVVQIHKQVQTTNPNGLHKALISPETHQKLVAVMNGRPKTQAGPMKDGNPNYPLNNRVTHKPCADATNGRLVGFDVTNGKNKERVYHKYRCRACGKYINQDELHSDVMQQFKKHPMTDKAKERIASALETSWKRREREAAQQAQALRQRIEGLTTAVKTQAVEAIKPENAVIKTELLAAIVDVKAQITELETDLQNLQTRTAASKTKFLRFALDFIAHMEKRFLAISKENRLRLEQIIFPGGFILNADKKVLTPKISPFYRLEAIKKSAEALDISLMVRVKGL